MSGNINDANLYGCAAPAARPPTISRLITLFRTLLKSKIHRASVIHCELSYESSCTVKEVRSTVLCNNLETLHEI